MRELAGKLVVITGASAGIGLACARLFAERGAHLLLMARRLERLREVASELRGRHGVEVLAFGVDVSRKEEVDALAGRLPERWLAPDILINNAGLARGLDRAWEAEWEHWKVMVRTNVLGLLAVTRLFLPGMVERGEGLVINVGSIAGYESYPGGSVYCGTKYFVTGFTRALAMELAGTGVQATCVAPGMVKTEFSLVRYDWDREAADAVYDGFEPLTAEDVAEAVLFCASRRRGSYIRELVVMASDQGSATYVIRRS